MPQAVLGGAAVMMFSSIVVSGIQLITKEKMTPRTLTIVSVALGVGYGMGANAKILANTPQFVQLICGESGIVPALPLVGHPAQLPAAPAIEKVMTLNHLRPSLSLQGGLFVL